MAACATWICKKGRSRNSYAPKGVAPLAAFLPPLPTALLRLAKRLSEAGIDLASADVWLTQAGWRRQGPYGTVVDEMPITRVRPVSVRRPSIRPDLPPAEPPQPHDPCLVCDVFCGVRSSVAFCTRRE